MKRVDTAKPLGLAENFRAAEKKAFPLENKDAASTFNSTSPEEENNYLYEFLIGCKLSQSLEKLFQMCNIISL